MPANDTIYKTYDIRGTYPDQINPDLAYQIAQAFCALTQTKKVVVGYDNRLGSKAIQAQLIQGVMDSGATVVDIGMVPTPQLYFASGFYKIPDALMVTASHTPAHETGVKFITQGRPFSPDQMLELKRLILSGPLTSSKLTGQRESKNCLPDYVEKLRGFVTQRLSPFRLVLDPGNSALGPLLMAVFGNWGMELECIHLEVAENFPHRGPNPKLPKNQAPIKNKIWEVEADFGFMWDGDGDRFYAFDSNSEVISPQFVAALMAEYLVSSHQGSTVTVEVRTGQVVRDLVEKAGGQVLVLPAWHVEIKLAMEQSPSIIFGSETSGHYVFRDMYKSDDGLLAALMFLQAVSAKKEPFKKIHHQLKTKYFVVEEINFDFTGNPQKIYPKLAEKYADGEINYIDGLTVTYPQWRFNLRASRTEPYLRLNLDATNHQVGNKNLKELQALIPALTNPT